MCIAILGATGCVGQCLVNKLIKSTRHEVIASYRSEGSINKGLRIPRVDWRNVDLQDSFSVQKFLSGAEVLVYLVHSLGSSKFESLDVELAKHTADVAKKTGIIKIIYLSGIIPRQQTLSPHLRSRMLNGEALASSGIPVAEVRASILLGTCSASYRIVYFLAKRLPIMITPRWLNSLCAPIAIEDAVDTIVALVTWDISGHKIFEIGSDVLRYRDLLALCGESIRGYRNIIVPVPFFAISLSSLWIELITGVSNSVARALAESLINDTVYSHNSFKELTGKDPAPVDKALCELAQKMKERH